MVENQENPKPSSKDELWELEDVALGKFSSSHKPTVTNSIDIYAVQCGVCHKWRVIDSQDEYEVIRSNFTEDPFTCSRKAGVSCKDPADIEYDASRTWVIDKPNIPKTPQGFKRSLILRKDFTKLDAYYIAPSGKKMRTRNEIAAFLEANPEFSSITLNDFSFHCPKIMEETIPEHIEKKGSGGGSASSKKSRIM